MAEDSKTIIIPDNQNNNGWAGLPVSIPLTGLGLGNNYPYPPYAYGMGNNGMFGGSGAGAFIGALFGSALGNWWGGNGGFGMGGNNGAAAALGAQATAIGNTDSILRAIDGTDSDVRLLATTLNSDVNTVKSNLSDLQVGLATLAGQTGLSREQILNGVLMGDASISRQLCECCCENRLLTTEQGYQAQIRTIEQTNQLGSQADRNTASVIGAINAFHNDVTREFCEVREREMQEKINSLTANNTLLRSQIDNANQTAAIAGLIAPIAKEVDDIKCRMPQTVPVQWPQLTAVNTTPYVNGGFYGNAFGNGFFGGFGNGFGGNIVF